MLTQKVVNVSKDERIQYEMMILHDGEILLLKRHCSTRIFQGK